MVAHKF
jgi:light-harvesting complex II chlorophyll a/b binding protein 4